MYIINSSRGSLNSYCNLVNLGLRGQFLGHPRLSRSDFSGPWLDSNAEFRLSISTDDLGLPENIGSNPIQ